MIWAVQVLFCIHTSGILITLLHQVVYRSLLHLSWVDKLVDNIKTIFVELYGEQLTKPHTTLVECHSFGEYFDQQLKELDKSSHVGSISPIDEESASHTAAAGLKYRGHAANGTAAHDTTSADSTPIQTPNASRPSTPGNLVVAKAGPVAKMSRRARKAHNSGSAPASSGDEALASSRLKKGAKATKKGRKWNADGFADEEDDDVQLDYSRPSLTSDSEAEAVGRSSALDAVESSTWGSTSKGKFILKDLGDEVHDILASAEAQKAEKAARADTKTGLLGSGVNTISGLFRNVVGGKTLTKEDLDKAMKGMEDHLLRKNVAREAAVRLCEGVEKELVGVKTGNFESECRYYITLPPFFFLSLCFCLFSSFHFVSEERLLITCTTGINAKIQVAMESSLTKMLTPTSSLDLLREIDSITAPPVTSLRKARPYVISIVGVNGVGKSTNLSKICFFLLQNKYKVLIAAGDTFRSGAVEQLAVHVRNLKELTAREGGKVELYQKGYGKDAAAVAKDAVNHAAQEGYDVVLIDTAGRRHNDQRLMSSLEKFAKFAQPDKILMVGEVRCGFTISPTLDRVCCSFTNYLPRLLLERTPLPKRATSMRPLAPIAPWTASSSPSATPSVTWSAPLSVWSTRPTCPLCLWELASITLT